MSIFPVLCFFIFETFCPSFLYTNCKGSNDLLMEMSDPFSVPESLRYWGAEIPRKIRTGDYSEQENRSFIQTGKLLLSLWALKY